MVPALQPAAPASPTAAAPATTELESASDALGARAQPRLVTQPEAGELDAISARALAAALPQPSNRPAVAAGAGPGAEALTAPDPMAQALPATQATATGAEPLVDAPPVQRHVATPMGQRGWDQAVSQQVSWLVRDQLQSASLSLNPPHLGPIQITLQLDQQQASVQFVAAAPEVRQALQEALPVLRAMLGEAGISLGQADVGSRQSGREQAAPQRAARGTQAVEDEPVEALLPPRAQGSGLVNLFALIFFISLPFQVTWPLLPPNPPTPMPAQDRNQPGKNGCRLRLLALVGAGAAGGWFIWKGSSKQESHAEEQAAAALQPPVFHPLEPFTVNLNGDGQFLQIALTLQLASQKEVEHLKVYLPQVRSRLLMLISSKTGEEI